MEAVFITGFLGLCAGGAYWMWRLSVSLQKLHEKEVEIPELKIPAPHVTIDTQALHSKIEEMPNKVLQSITSSANTHKGSLGELIGYINIKAQYDRIVPLGNIVDFMCIRFPKGEDPGCVDFIDVKTGNSSRLSKDQRNLQKLIDNKHINFVKLKVDTSIHESKPKPNKSSE